MNPGELLNVVFNGVLAGMILLTAGFLLTSRDFLQAAALFIAFGLLMALAWVRLAAPDIALAEAAIGTGITGVLLIDTVRHLRPTPLPPTEGPCRRRRWPVLALALPGLAAAALALGLLVAVFHLAPPDSTRAEEALAAMDYLAHPVTAVLLVFRGMDTLLELGVLVLALLGMLTVRGTRSLAAVGMVPPDDPVLQGVVRVLVPLAVLVAGYFLWLGTFSAGGAFQSGVILGAAGVLLWLSGHRGLDHANAWTWLSLVLAGFVVFLAVAAGTMVFSDWALEFPPSMRSALIQVMEVSAAVSIGATLTALFIGLHRRPEPSSRGTPS